MTTKLITAGVILVAAIVFGLIFWNQFTANQQNLAGGNPAQQQTQTQGVPKNDSITSIESDLNAVDVNNVDSGSTDINSQFSGF